MNWRFAFTALLIGAIAGLAAVVFWGYGPLVALVVVALTAWAYRGRGHWVELPWILVGVGIPPVALLWRGITNADPTIQYAPETVPAFVIGLGVLAVGLVLLGLGWFRRTPAGRRDPRIRTRP